MKLEQSLEAIGMAAEFLRDLQSPKYTKRVPSIIRKRAQAILDAGYPATIGSPGIRAMTLRFIPIPLGEIMNRKR